MRRFRIRIIGTSPYMQHRMDTKKLKDWEKSRGKIMERDNADTPFYTQALFHSHLTPEGHHYVPVSHLKQSFIGGSKQHKAKVGGAARSMKAIVSGSWHVERAKDLPDYVKKQLPQPLHRYTVDEIPMRPFDVVDERSAVNGAAKARVMTYRPKWLDWSLTFDLVISEPTITISQIRDIITTAGSTVGIGSYRPEHTGEFGRFVLDTYEDGREKIDFIGEEEIEKPKAEDPRYW